MNFNYTQTHGILFAELIFLYFKKIKILVALELHMKQCDHLNVDRLIYSYFHERQNSMQIDGFYVTIII